MEQRTLSITGALIELNLLEKRIARANNSSFLAFQKGKDLPVGYKNVDEVKSAISGNLDSVKDLIELRNKIKSGIVISNATTEVTVGTQVMTVAEAIDRKSSIQFDKELLGSMKNQYRQVSAELIRYNDNVKGKADSMADAFLGRDTDKEVKKEAEAIRDSYIASNEGKLIDPISILKTMEELEASIEDFEANVDLALSISNAKTEIIIG